MEENTFSKALIINEKSVFRAVLRSNLRVKTRGFVVSANKNTKGRSRLGMCVSKKIIPKSVARNAIKRKVRETFRIFASKQIVGFDIVVRVYRKPCNELNELSELWRKLKHACNS
ncbi:MAG: ribonuclease P protein component [Francisellaceae bacterium]|nr:ribonuclease P protein component [Francisellaceae bacterium]MBT6538549.1 ribonuclease P protein component [Francisellaceae bacterium]